MAIPPAGKDGAPERSTYLTTSYHKRKKRTTPVEKKNRTFVRGEF